MARIVGRDSFGNSVQFTADAQPCEPDAATTAETAAAKSGSGGLTSLSVSGQSTLAALSASGLTTLLGGVTLGTVGALTAGTTQTLAGATALKTISVVNAANASDGVKFNVAATGSGRVFIVISVGSTATMKIWPNALDSIDGGSAGVATTLTAAHRMAIFIDSAANNWTSGLLATASS